MQTDERWDGVAHHRAPDSRCTDEPASSWSLLSADHSPLTATLQSTPGEIVPGIMVQWESGDAVEAESALRLGRRCM